MIADVWTVAWKEWKELLWQSGSLRGGVARLALLLAFIGVIMPLEMGRRWVDSPMVLLNSGWLPLVLVISLTVDSFAGERERHTLETLLSSRLPDLAILLGKLVAAVGYGWGAAMAGALLGLLTCNLAFWPGSPLLYSPALTVAMGVLGLTTAALGASAGLLASLRAPTVRQAAQTLSLGMLIGGSALGLAAVLGYQALPFDWRLALIRQIVSTSLAGASLPAAAALAVLAAGLLLAAMARFRRARLLLD